MLPKIIRCTIILLSTIVEHQISESLEILTLILPQSEVPTTQTKDVDLCDSKSTIAIQKKKGKKCFTERLFLKRNREISERDVMITVKRVLLLQLSLLLHFTCTNNKSPVLKKDTNLNKQYSD